MRGTLKVGATLNSFATHKWISLQTGGTATGGTMIASKALGIQGTGIGNQTGTDTLTVQALFVRGTLII